MCCALLAFLFVCMWHKIVTAQECLAWRPCCSYPHCFKAKSSGPHKPRFWSSDFSGQAASLLQLLHSPAQGPDARAQFGAHAVSTGGHMLLHMFLIHIAPS
eukprot:1159756-Pelagomonas_calceolata.AAC.9